MNYLFPPKDAIPTHRTPMSRTLMNAVNLVCRVGMEMPAHMLMFLFGHDLPSFPLNLDVASE